MNEGGVREEAVNGPVSTNPVTAIFAKKQGAEFPPRLELIDFLDRLFGFFDRGLSGGETSDGNAIR